MQRIHELYDVVDEIGRGKFAVVFKGRDKRTGQDVAIKVANKRKLDAKDLQAIHDEVTIAQTLRHSNIVQILGTSEDENVCAIVMELYVQFNIPNCCALGFRPHCDQSNGRKSYGPRRRGRGAGRTST